MENFRNFSNEQLRKLVQYQGLKTRNPFWNDRENLLREVRQSYTPERAALVLKTGDPYAGIVINL